MAIFVYMLVCYNRPMKLQKFEQSGFILETNSGFRLGFDIANKTPLEKLEGITVDAMLVSHIHGDHFSVPQIKVLAPKDLYLNHECIELLGEESLECNIHEVKVGDSIEVSGIKVEFFNVDHGPNVSAPLTENFGFLITADEQTVYFAGDMFYESGIDVTNLSVDYALLPVGGFYTFGPAEALEFAKKFKHIGNIIPMHYEKDPETKYEFIELNDGMFNI